MLAPNLKQTIEYVVEIIIDRNEFIGEYLSKGDNLVSLADNYDITYDVTTERQIVQVLTKANALAYANMLENELDTHQGREQLIPRCTSKLADLQTAQQNILALL